MEHSVDRGGERDAEDLRRTANSLAAAWRAVSTLRDTGLPVQMVIERTRSAPDGSLRAESEWLVTMGDDPPADETAVEGALVTLVDDQRADGRSFFGVCIEWKTARQVRVAAAASLERLMDEDEGFPDPLPHAMRRNGCLHEAMSTAIRAALEFDDFNVRADTDYRPYGMWLVD